MSALNLDGARSRRSRRDRGARTGRSYGTGYAGSVSLTPSSPRASRIAAFAAARAPCTGNAWIRSKEECVMLTPARKIFGLSIAATDGQIGTVKDLYFDDLSWTVRYLVVDSGKWLPGRKVLISPMSVTSPDLSVEVPVKLTREQVKQSPPIEADKPVDRQQEEVLARYYNYTYYWDGPYRWGLLAYPGLPPVPPAGIAAEPAAAELAARSVGDSSLRSARDVTGYNIAALDGDLGHVEDFLVDSRAWAIRYLVVDTANWWPGKKVVVSPEWIKTVSWSDSRVYVDLRRDEIKSAPEYDPSGTFERDYESRLFEHHGRRKYWEWEDR